MKKYSTVLIYGVGGGSLIIVLKLLEHRLFSNDISFDIFIALIALIFTSLGVWAGGQILGKVIVKPEPQTANPVAHDQNNLKQTGLSTREYEVLLQMSRGLSNQEIAEKLFISLSTVKTHTSNVFSKLNVNSRMHAVQKARELRLVEL